MHPAQGTKRAGALEKSAFTTPTLADSGKASVWSRARTTWQQLLQVLLGREYSHSRLHWKQLHAEAALHTMQLSR